MRYVFDAVYFTLERIRSTVADRRTCMYMAASLRRPRQMHSKPPVNANACGRGGCAVPWNAPRPRAGG